MLVTLFTRYASLVRQVLLPSRFPGLRRYLQRVLVLGAGLPLFTVLQLLHGVGFLLDELLFPGYHRVVVRRPLFILGVPRSGTTYLHRLLAADTRFTTLSLWECLFAPSISERYLVLGLAALDRRLGAPLARLLRLVERRCLARFDAVHAVSLEAAEEDFLLLLPILCCFLLVVPFPEARWLWRVGCMDRDLPAAERRQILGWYRRCLQKHLYVHGAHRTLLSKNASFAGMANSLADAFPDAVMAVCERDALQVIGSQFNALAEGLALFGAEGSDPAFRDNLLQCLQFYYRNLDELADRRPVVTVNARQLAREPRALVERIYRDIGLAVDAGVDAGLSRAAYGGPHRPVTTPPLSRWGLDEVDLANRFAPWCRREARL